MMTTFVTVDSLSIVQGDDYSTNQLYFFYVDLISMEDVNLFFLSGVMKSLYNCGICKKNSKTVAILELFFLVTEILNCIYLNVLCSTCNVLVPYIYSLYIHKNMGMGVFLYGHLYTVLP